MDRPDRHGFVPHLTLRRNAPDPVTRAAPTILCGQLARWRVDRVHLLEQLHHGAETIWSPIAEEPFGGPVVVGRGGIEVHLRTVGTDEPERVQVLAELAGAPGAVIARADGSVGAGLARLATLEVAEEHRGLGIARQVLARWCTDAARRGATVAIAEPGAADPTSIEALLPLGFALVGDPSAGAVAVRKLPRASAG
jgi:GNAT superfamily N-acetyltransferase